MCLLSAELRSPTHSRTVLGMNHAPRVSPVFVEPMLSLAVPNLPEGPEWTYELKFDGFRVVGQFEIRRHSAMRLNALCAIILTWRTAHENARVIRLLWQN
jgi:hypothetical protein